MLGNRVGRSLFALAVVCVTSLVNAVPSQAVFEPEQASDGQFPWMATAMWSYYDDGGFFHEEDCPGTIIAATWMLTSGNCARAVRLSAPGGVLVVAGDTDLSTPETRPGRTAPAVATFAHVDHDVGLIRLGSSVSVPRIRLAGPADEALEAPGTRLTVAGFYSNPAPSIGTPEIVSGQLTYRSVSVVKDGQCKKPHGLLAVVNDIVNLIIGAEPTDEFSPATQICTEAVKNSHCRSGNPLFAGSGSQSVQLGIYSDKLVSQVCANTPGTPSIHTEINSPDIRNWIRSVSGM